MTLQQMRYFIAVAQNLSFSKAAQQHYVSLWAVSQQIKVVIDTPGADNFVALLNDAQRQVQIFGPGTYRVIRSEARPGGAAIGVFSET